ncbi:MAG: alkaline phosphatase family protein [Desulfobulbales bacterium]|nr:alkaline phosphatase family protein [Desulfobulbales bacterium]
MDKPDYRNSIVNLAVSLFRSRGCEPNGYEPLAGLDPLELAGRPVVVLIVDGLGDNFLQRYPDSFLCRHRRGRLSSVFPPTTASAMTSFFTGAAPQQHGITGWYTYFRELGTVATVLPFVPRYGGVDFSKAGIRPGRLIDAESQFSALAGPCHFALPDYLVDSVYSQALSGTACRHGYGSPEELFALLEKFAGRGGGNDLVIGYWPELDSLGHACGIESPEAADLFHKLDRCCRDSLPRLAAAGAAVIVCADHGLIDAPQERVINLEEHPRLAGTLTLPLCGEPRCAYCYVRSDRKEDFERYIAEELDFACELKRSREMILEGYFGLGHGSPRLEERVGEYALLMKDDYIIKDRLLSEENSPLVGVHGGLSADELYVPLILVPRNP